MADKDGRPIHASSPVSPIGGVAANIDPHAPKCVGCGRYHGSVGVATLCLEDTVRSLRRASSSKLLPTNILDATARLLLLAFFLGQTSKKLTAPMLRDAAEQAAADVARCALFLEARFSFGTQARDLAGLSHPDADQGEHP